MGRAVNARMADILGVMILVANPSEVLRVDPDRGAVSATRGLEDERPTALAAHPDVPGRAWCATHRGGVFRSDDGGASWTPAGLRGERLMTVAAGPADPGRVWAGAEPSAVWRSDDAGARWTRATGLEDLPSAGEWAFPPRPDTHHVRWIACHPEDPGRLWVAIEAGALVATGDAGRTWRDRVPGGPFDTHELAVHPAAPGTLRVSAGDGYYESFDGGATWSTPEDGLDVTYCRSVAVDPGDPDTVVISAASHPHSAYVAGGSDGRLYRRGGGGPWTRVRDGWPDPPVTIAPLLSPGRLPGELWAADERGLHHSDDGGRGWRRVAAFDPPPHHLRGLAVPSLEG